MKTTMPQRRHRCIDLPHLPTTFLVMLLAALCLVMVTAAGCSVTGAGGSSGVGGSTITVRPTLTPRAPARTPGPFGAPAADRGIQAITPTKSGVPSFTTDDMRTYALSHPLPGTIADNGTPSVTRDEFLQSQILALLLHTPTDRPDGTLMGYFEEKGDFTFAGATADHPLHFPIVYWVFDAQTGNLVFFGGLAQPTPTNSPTPTIAPVVRFHVTPTSFQQACTSPTDPLPALTITLDNTGSNVSVGYQVTNIGNVPNTAEPWATASPASGTVAAGKQAQVTLTPATDICSKLLTQTNFTAGIHLTSGGSGTTAITDSVSPFTLR